MLAVNQGCLKSITASTSILAMITDHYHILESFEPPPLIPISMKWKNKNAKFILLGQFLFGRLKCFGPQKLKICSEIWLLATLP